jgi:hypothetical protein
MNDPQSKQNKQYEEAEIIWFLNTLPTGTAPFRCSLCGQDNPLDELICFRPSTTTIIAEIHHYHYISPDADVTELHRSLANMVELSGEVRCPRSRFHKMERLPTTLERALASANGSKIQWQKRHKGMQETEVVETNTQHSIAK